MRYSVLVERLASWCCWYVATARTNSIQARLDHCRYKDPRPPWPTDPTEISQSHIITAIVSGKHNWVTIWPYDTQRWRKNTFCMRYADVVVYLYIYSLKKRFILNKGVEHEHIVRKHAKHRIGNITHEWFSGLSSDSEYGVIHVFGKVTTREQFYRNAMYRDLKWLRDTGLANCYIYMLRWVIEIAVTSPLFAFLARILASNPQTSYLMRRSQSRENKMGSKQEGHPA